MFRWVSLSLWQWLPMNTAVDENAVNVFYIIQGNEATPDELLTETAQKVIDTTVKYCGGTGRIIIPQVI